MGQGLMKEITGVDELKERENVRNVETWGYLISCKGCMKRVKHSESNDGCIS